MSSLIRVAAQAAFGVALAASAASASAIPMPAQAQVPPADIDALAAWILATK